MGLAELYRQTGQSEQAIPLLKQNISPRTPESQIASLLAAYLEAGQAEEGLQFLRSRTHWDFKQADSHYLVGKTYQESGDWQEAIAPLQTAICTSSEPKLEYYRLLAAVYNHLGETQRAIEWLKEVDDYLSSGQLSAGPSESLCRL